RRCTSVALAGVFASQVRRSGGARNRDLASALPGVSFYPGRLQKNGPARLQHLLCDLYRSVDRVIEGDAQRNSACRQSPPTRASRWRIERQDAKPERKPPKSGGGRKLRDGRVVTRPNQTTRKRTGGIRSCNFRMSCRTPENGPA